MMRLFTAAFWQDAWTDVHCFVAGHIWHAWQDGHDGYYWRHCADCHTQERKSYIEAIVEKRQAHRAELARKDKD